MITYKNILKILSVILLLISLGSFLAGFLLIYFYIERVLLIVFMFLLGLTCLIASIGMLSNNSIDQEKEERSTGFVSYNSPYNSYDDEEEDEYDEWEDDDDDDEWEEELRRHEEEEERRREEEEEERHREEEEELAMYEDDY